MYNYETREDTSIFDRFLSGEGCLVSESAAGDGGGGEKALFEEDSEVRSLEEVEAALTSDQAGHWDREQLNSPFAERVRTLLRWAEICKWSEGEER